MKVKIASVQRVKERGEEAKVVCQVHFFSKVSAWLPYQTLNKVLASSGNTNQEKEKTLVGWDQKPLDETAFLFDKKRQEALASELEKRLNDKRLTLGGLFDDTALGLGLGLDSLKAYSSSEGFIVEDVDIPASPQLHNHLIKNLIRCHSTREKLHALNALKAASDRFNLFAAALTASALFSWLLRRLRGGTSTGNFSTAGTGFVFGILVSARMVYEVLTQHMRDCVKALADDTATVGDPGLAEASLQRVLDSVVAEIVRVKGKSSSGENATEERTQEELAKEEAVIKDLDAAEAAERHEEAFNKAQAHMKELQQEGRQPTFDFLWRYVRAVYSHAADLAAEGEADGQGASLLRDCLPFSQELVDRFPESHESHKWHALVYFDHMESQGTKQTVLAGLEFHKMTLHAISLNDSDPRLHVMLGSFNYEVAKLSWTERLGVKAIFGHEPPKASFDDALESFHKAIACRPDAKPIASDKLLIGKCYLKMNEKDKARESFNACIEIQSSSNDHRPKASRAAKAAKGLLAKC